ncbi:hypothetical protein [Parvularcula maris]|uniref:Uncharacterized protein n=1 Tax=Parvularcula maris TaxID=2965077 RepID=A0A9X2RIN7_9PROT|nr:hypothetical protein [Parvularcula maris]MCQ8184037.1 hypothetical protein [Parvularcula maris]
MSELMNDLQGAFGGAAGADPLLVLLPIALVAIAQGLRSDGFGEVIARSLSGIFIAALLIFLVGGLLGADRFNLGMWQDRVGGTWDSLLGIHFVEVLGFWLLILVGAFAVFSVRSLVRR